jgi:hypothetical protein
MWVSGCGIDRQQSKAKGAMSEQRWGHWLPHGSHHSAQTIAIFCSDTTILVSHSCSLLSLWPIRLMPRTQRCCVWCKSKKLQAARMALFRFRRWTWCMQLLHLPHIYINLCKFWRCICLFVAVLCTRVSYCMWSDCAIGSEFCCNAAWLVRESGQKWICLGIGTSSF